MDSSHDLFAKVLASIASADLVNALERIKRRSVTATAADIALSIAQTAAIRLEQSNPLY